jgi:hypothetical protein
MPQIANKLVTIFCLEAQSLGKVEETETDRCTSATGRATSATDEALI